MRISEFVVFGYRFRMSGRISHDDSFDLRWLRSAIELAICFVIAVIMLRAFVLEGYLISTGSMAPGLVGFHRRIVCPACQRDFAFGVSFDDSVESGASRIVEPEGARQFATCPNCGRNRISVSGVPNSHGDQLLVQRHVYDLRRPNRWETIVFRNPASPGEAFVKRVVGLPGERIRVANGDIWINGQLARKNFEQQLAMRIPVSNLHHLAAADEWQMPWDIDDGWLPDGGDLLLASQEETAEEKDLVRPLNPTSPETPRADSATVTSGTQWIRFRNWRWFGGHHVAETPLAPEHAMVDWKNFLARFDTLPITWITRVDYDEERQVLRCEGVMRDEMQRDLLKKATDEGFRRAVYRLAALSHLAPLTDRYGYNAMVESPEYVVCDLMLRIQLTWTTAPTAIRVQIPVGADVFGLVVHPQDSTADLIAIDEKTVIRSGRYLSGSPTSSELPGQPHTMLLEVSNFDQQVVVVINGQPVFQPYEINHMVADEALEASVSTVAGQKMDATKAAQISLRLEQQNRWAVGVSGSDARITDLEMYRDVFYTPGKKRNAIGSEFRVPEESYFVQGDNSPVSSDSRNWERPCVPHSLLIGKPFLVHLPSRPAVLQFAGRRWPVRIPDWQRIRYIR